VLNPWQEITFFMKNLLNCAVAVLLASATSVCAADKDAKDVKAPAPAYDTAAMIDVHAKVTEVREVPKSSAMDGLHLILQSAGETLDVYVGPNEFVKIFEVTFKKGDDIHVIGSKVSFEGSPVVLAREVSIGTVTILCRDKEGEPLWKYFLKPPVG
jgi:hypothetical protein